MQKTIHLSLQLLLGAFLFLAPLLPMQCVAQDSGITLVSDTTDDEEFDTTSVVAADATDSCVQITDVEVPSWWHYFLGDGIGWDIAEKIFTTGGIIMLLMLFCFFLSPILAIVLIIYIIMRGSRKHQAQPQPYYSTSPQPMHRQASRNIEKEKDRLVISTALAIGIFIFFMAYQWTFGALLALIYLCVQAGRFYNLYRAQKRINDNEENNTPL